MKANIINCYYSSLKLINPALLLFFFVENSYTQSQITPLSTDNYETVEVSNDLVKEISYLFDNQNVQSKFFEINGVQGIVKLDYNLLESRIKDKIGKDEDGLYLHITNAFNENTPNGYENFIRFSGKYGVTDIKMILRFVGKLKYIITITNLANNKIIFDYTGYTNTIRVNSNNTRTEENSYYRSEIDYSERIRSLLIAEEERDFDKIYSHYSSNLKKYWSTNNPSYSELKRQYENAWKSTSYSKNYIKRIEKINNNTYDLYTKFEFFRIKKIEY